MRNAALFNNGWKFVREDAGHARAADKGISVQLPHTWNAVDGQDGGNDYYRGKCWYTKQFVRPATQPGEEVWLEFEGVAMVAEVYLNGRLLGSHMGGYSTFRVNITDALQDQNTLAVSADNSFTPEVYPQKADFTFYGGIYRDVWLLIVPKAHFALGYNGGPGIKVTPKLADGNAEVAIEAWLENTPDGTLVCFAVDGVGEVQSSVRAGKAEATLYISNAHLWDGVNDPYLYTARAALANGDEVSYRFGCRSFSFDAEKGFFLNGRSYPLCGAARHQDREGVGYAVTREMHREDLELLQEMGANTIRLAHYQHAQYFYDLCDEAGMVVWAEIPYISEHMPEGNANTEEQMTDLVVQCYNHPSIVCWGLSNEITSTGGVTEDMIENHKRLNELCHRLDATRPTTVAEVFMLSTSRRDVLEIPDIRSYNLYYGWYLGELEDNDKWFDDFHALYPDMVIGLSEFGADANPQYHSAAPERGDYTESYQALYHEHMLQMWAKRPYIWAMHMWNMFDFAADGRDEGGKHGVNQKGLVTFDRKTKKDAFYIYKAYLSKTPFVHLCGSRYVERPETVTEVKVYSNLPEVTLYVDGVKLQTQQGSKVFKFQVPISGEHSIEAKASGCAAVMLIRKVSAPNPAYCMAGGEVVNWFDKDDMVVREGYYSIKDTMADIKKSPQGAGLLAMMQAQMVEKRGDVAKGVEIPPEMQAMMDKTTMEKMLKMAGEGITPEQVKQLNYALNQIPREG